MTNLGQVVGLDATSSLMEQLGKAIHELEALRSTSENRVCWLEIEEHFCNLGRELKKKFEEFELRDKEFEKKETDTKVLLAEREAVVAAKEEALLDRVQGLKDIAVAAIAEAREIFLSASSAPTDDEDHKVNNVSISLADKNFFTEDFTRKIVENSEVTVLGMKPHPELMQFCQQMDAKGLLNYMINNQNKFYSIREELSAALESAPDPAILVLDSLEGFDLPVETIQSGDERDAAQQGMQKSCIVLMEAMLALLARPDSDIEHVLNHETKQKAKAIADEWRLMLPNPCPDAANGYSLEAEAFLLLLATFRIASEFDEEELCNLFLAVGHHSQAPELCQCLGLTHKMPGLVESLISSGRQFDAIQYIRAFELTEHFPLVPILKDYLKTLRRNLQVKCGPLGSAPGVQNDANAQELSALKAVIKCIKEHNLERDYPLDPLQKRVTQLERVRSDKRRVGEFGRRQQPKKRRGNSGFRATRAAPARKPPQVFSDRASYLGMAERYAYMGPNTYDYQIPNQPAYGQSSIDQRMYYLNPQEEGAPPTSYATAPSLNYGSYAGSSFQPSQQPYM